MKRIGILGGTFDPIHYGHLAIADVAREKLNLDKVIFVPAYLPPHKTRNKLVSAKHRYEMVRLAIKGNPFFKVSDVEIKRRGKSYSIDTVNEINKKNPSAKLFFIIGADSYKQLSSWRQIDELYEKLTFVVFDRKGYLKRKTSKKVKFISSLEIEISSSYIRMNIQRGKTVKYLIPENVYHYIEKKRLYS